jgi:hypothetical protein
MRNRIILPDHIVLIASLTDDNMQEAMDFLVSGEALPHCKIFLDDNLITPAQLRMLFAALSHPQCPPHLEISLEGNHLNSDTMNLLFADFFENSIYPQGLQFNFARNNISDIGFMAMVDALNKASKKPGVYIDVQFNPMITNDSIDYLCERFKQNDLPGGTGFDLRFNVSIDYQHAQKLVECLPKNTCVTALSLDTGEQEIREAVNVIDDHPYAMLPVPNCEAVINFCCERNRQLQEHRKNPDMIYHLRRLSYEAGYPLPAKAGLPFPTLQFLAAKTCQQNGRPLRLPECFDDLNALAAAITAADNKLGPGRNKSRCPWPCTIL